MNAVSIFVVMMNVVYEKQPVVMDVVLAHVMMEIVLTIV
jgi:hypothetical protein